MALEVRCPTCAAVSSKGARVCPHCGTIMKSSPHGDPSEKITALDDTLTDEEDSIEEPVVVETTNTKSTGPSLIGTKVQDYVIEARLGGGAMGVVYRATHALIGKAVAIKVLRPDVSHEPRDMERLLDEARVISTVKNRGIINIFGAGTLEDGRNYLIMELLEGEGLDKHMKRQPVMPVAEVIVILEQVLAALAAAHEAGVVHRDLKPANVFLVKEGPSFYVKLLDFGLARRNQTSVTRIAGTPDYISPEHARGRPAGPASDLYSFGVLCFRMLTGQLPFTGPTPLQVMKHHVQTAPPVPRALNPEIPKALSDLILKLLSKEPGQRPDAAQVKADLRSTTTQIRAAATDVGLSPVVVSQQQVASVSDETLEPVVSGHTGDFKRSFRAAWPWLLGAGLGMALFLVLASFLWPARKPSLEENPDGILDAQALSMQKKSKGVDKLLQELETAVRSDPRARAQVSERAVNQVTKLCEEAVTMRQLEVCENQLLRLRRRFDK